jgi:alkylation response protein AidB-like acyl-CoA dehydrogenase
MPFITHPLVGGDAFDMALRIGLEADRELAYLADPAEQAACLRRYWDSIAELGWMATAIPEELGGAGGDLGDLAALAGGAGRGGLALPVALACAVVPGLLSITEQDGQAIHADAALGRARICAILPGAARDEATAAPGLTMVDGRLTLCGAAVGVEMPPDPTHLLLVCDEADPVLLLLPVDACGIACDRYQRIDGRLAGDWNFDDVAVDSSWILARGGEVLRRAEEARDRGALLTCIECVSAMGAIIEQTIEYLSSRVQFGVALSSFQALQHRVAEMYVEYENLRGLVGQALRAATVSARPPWRDIAFAKLRLGEAGRFVAQEAIQCHGGMGMTEALPAIRLARRVMMAEFEFGDRTFQAKRLLADARQPAT